ncbi:MAG: hypothetical protein AAF675_14360 [Pseudomonadota bacterium]
MREPTDAEQLYLELINRARANPAGEFALLVPDPNPDAPMGATAEITEALDAFSVNLTWLQDGLASAAPVAPLAWDLGLGQSALTHSKLMADFNTESNQLPGEPSLSERFENAGYTGSFQRGELIFARSSDPMHGFAALLLDWGPGIGGIKSPPSNRNALLSPVYGDIGVGNIEILGPRPVGPEVLTIHLGARIADARLTGVVINDTDEDFFYDIGEGLGGVTISASGPAGTYETTSFASGGYTLALPDGDYTVTVSGGPLSGGVTRNITIAGENQKQDFRSADAGGQRIIGGDEDETLIGTPFDDTIIDRGGSNRLEGRAGNDRLITGVGDDTVLGEDGDDVIKTSDGNDTIYGGPGADTILSGIGDDVIEGGEGDDVIKASEGVDIIDGGPGDDTIFGWRGQDVVNGGPGDDVLRGDFDEDRIEGGPGDDRILGGPGRDVFVFRPGFDEDRILDFNTALEKLDFTGFAGVTGIEDLTISQISTNVVIVAPDNSRLVLADATIDVISEGDFIFG